MQTPEVPWKQEIVTSLTSFAPLDRATQALVKRMCDFIHQLPATSPEPHEAGLTEHDDGYVLWHDESSQAMVEVFFVPGYPPSVHVGHEDGEPQYLCCYTRHTRRRVNLLIHLLEETPTCH